MAAVFTPNRSLLNSKFDGYKLDPLNEKDVMLRLPLPHKLSQTAQSSKTPLSFQEVQSRIRHNHLALGPTGNAVYIDSDMRVVEFELDDAELTPSFKVLYELPRQIQTDLSDGPHREYPSAVFLAPTVLFVADGNGTLYALRLQTDGPAELLNAFELLIPEQYSPLQLSVPFRLHAATRSPSGQCIALLSSKYYGNKPPYEGTSSSNHKRTPKFDIWGVSVDLDQVSQDQVAKLQVAWHKRGASVPVYVEYVDTMQAFMMLGNSPYRPLSIPTITSYQPSADEIVPIPRPNESLDSKDNPNALQPPPPYSWTQTSDTLTLAYPLPSNTPKEAIKVTFSPTTLTVIVSETVESSAGPPVALPKYSLKKLWDGIVASDCLWTFDRSAEHTYGLLTLHLDKQHEDTRWPQVFATVPGEEDVDVPETLDPSELYLIREALEKYTAALQTGEDASGLGLGCGVPSLAGGEMDEEVDLNSGDFVSLTWVALDGSVPSWGGKDDVQFSVLSTPLPGMQRTEPNPSLAVKNGLDGLVYTLDPAGDLPTWIHTSTYCVLSFVLASKRDTRFVHHVSSKAALAFESGARGMGCNVYIYRGTTRPGDKTAKQCVLKISDGSGGPLLGVGMTHTKDGRAVMLCLCERELVVMHDVL